MLSQITCCLFILVNTLPLSNDLPTKETLVIEHKYVYKSDESDGYDRVREDRLLIKYQGILLELDAVYDNDPSNVIYPTSLVVEGQDYEVIKVYDHLEQTRIQRVILVKAINARRWGFDRLSPVLEGMETPN